MSASVPSPPGSIGAGSDLPGSTGTGQEPAAVPGADDDDVSPVDDALVEPVRSRLRLVRERIAGAGVDPDQIRIVAVTKSLGPEAVSAAVAAGLTDVGENYADELLSKWGVAGRAVTWHFLGSIQRNKVARLAPVVDCWQGIARVVEGESISRHRPGSPPSLFVEVDTTGAAGRGGCTPGEVPEVVAGLQRLGWRVDGLMTVAPAGDEDIARSAFDQVARLRDDLGLAELSMGMSGDFEHAVAAGATMVRLGTALFGPRPQRRRL